MENFEITKDQLNNNEYLQIAKNNPIIKATIISLLKAVPVIGELIDESIDIALTKFQEKKREELLNIILSNNQCITTNRVNDIEFIMNFVKTLEAVNRLSTNDKVKYFALLIKNSYFAENKIDNDEFDEYLHMLSFLSFREIEHLVFLYNFEKNMPPEYSKRENYWKSFNEKLSEHITCREIDSFDIYKKLCGTGLVQELLKSLPANVEMVETRSRYYDGDDLMVSNIEFEHECFCLAVDLDSFIKHIQEDTTNDK